jgi:hypothetical protein
MRARRGTIGNTRHDFRLNYAAVLAIYFDVNRPEAHSALTRSAAILSQKA